MKCIYMRVAINCNPNPNPNIYYFKTMCMTIVKKTVYDGKKDQVCRLKDGTDGVVSTASTATSNPLPTLYCYDISGSNDRGG